MVTLRNANLQNGLRVGFSNDGGQTGERTVTLEIYGKNTIASPETEAVVLWSGNCHIVSGDPDATLSITGGTVKSFFFISSYDYESRTGLRLYDGDVTITGDNVRIACGARAVFDGIPRGGRTNAIEADGVVSIGGDQVKIEGCVTNSNYYSPAVNDDAEAVYILATQDRPMMVETGGYKTEAMEGTPFTTRTDVLSEAASQGKLWTKVVTPTPAPAVTPKPAVPTTGDGANIALWLGMLLLAMAGVISLKYRVRG